MAIRLIRRLLAWVRRGKHEADMAEEMRAHLEMQAERNRAAGMDGDDAHYAALREFGNVARVQERAREARVGRLGVWLEQAGQDLRYALRQLRRRPGFAAAVALTLALGIGANTVVFSVVDTLLLKPLPLHEPARVWSVGFFIRGDVTSNSISRPVYRIYAEENRAFAELCGFAAVTSSVKVAGKRQFMMGQLVTENYFSCLGVVPVIGRPLTPDDEKSGADVAVISHEYWQSRLGGSPDVLGWTLRFESRRLTIVGVAPPGFQGLNNVVRLRPSFWAPAALEKRLGQHVVYQLAGRLRDGVSREQAVADLDAITRNVHERFKGKGPVGFEKYGVQPDSTRARLAPAALGNWGWQWGGRDRIARLVTLFFVAVGLVLLIACANVANLLLARALSRRREMAVRLTLGATRGRLARQLVLESLLLSMLGAAAGLLLAHWGLAGLLKLRTGVLGYIPVNNLEIGQRAALFTLGLGTVTGLIFGLVPMWQAFRQDVTPGLKMDATSAAATGHPGRFALGNLLIVAQVAGCVVLLCGAGLCYRNFARLMEVDLGFPSRHVLVATVGVERGAYNDERCRQFIGQLAQRVAALPGVVGAVYAGDSTILSGTYVQSGVDALDGYEAKPDERIVFTVNEVGPAFFHLLGVPLLSGREFTERDAGSGAVPVALVNQSFVHRYWRNINPIGKRIQGREVVGVVGDIRWRDLARGAEPQVFFDLGKERMITSLDYRYVALCLKTAGEADLGGVLRSELQRLDATAELAALDSVEHLRAISLAGPRGLMQVADVLGFGALVLAMVGLYGVLSYSVGQRTKEIGVRMAVGAHPTDVQWMTIRQGLRLVGPGLLLGLCLAAAGLRGLQAWLAAIETVDASLYAGVVGGVAIIAFFACWLPARRAARVDPVVALRTE